MTRPLPALYDLLAGREVRSSAELITSAVEHRLTGQLWSAWQDGRVDFGGWDQHELAAADMSNQAHHERLWSALVDVVRCLTDAGIGVAAMKGVTSEARWYRRLGERPCGDVDVLLAPHDIDRIDEVLMLLAPDYEPAANATELVRQRKLQHVHFERGGVTIDLHLDPLKLGVWSASAAQAWESMVEQNAADGTPIRVMSPDMALVSAVTHLNKDRFASLGAYEEVVRIADDPKLDWEAVRRILAAEQLEVPFWCSLAAVDQVLQVGRSIEPMVGIRARLWEQAWPPQSRLLGDQGRSQLRKRQALLPWLLPHRSREARAEFFRLVFPPRELLDVHRPELRHRNTVLRRTLDRLGRS